MAILLMMGSIDIAQHGPAALAERGEILSFAVLEMSAN